MSVSALAGQLAQSGHEVWVYTTTANGTQELGVEQNTPLNVDGVNVIYFKRITKDHTHFSPTLLSALWKNARTFNVVHIHAWWNLVSVFSCMIALAKGVKVVISPRGTLSSYSFNHKTSTLKRLFHDLIGRRLLSNSYVHATSIPEEENLSTIIAPRLFFNIPNFVSLPPLTEHPEPTKEEDHLKILFLSRIDEKKGLDVLLRALSLLTLPWKLTIAGDGEPAYLQTLKDYANEKNIAGNITWAGFQNEAKFVFYRQHDIFVLPSHNENFGNVVIESLNEGTAVLLSKNVGLATFVTENKLGWVFELDEHSLAESISYAAKHPAERQYIRKYAPAFIRAHFNPTDLSKQYVAMYQQITRDDH